MVHCQTSQHKAGCLPLILPYHQHWTAFLHKPSEYDYSCVSLSVYSNTVFAGMVHCQTSQHKAGCLALMLPYHQR